MNFGLRYSKPPDLHSAYCMWRRPAVTGSQSQCKTQSDSPSYKKLPLHSNFHTQKKGNFKVRSLVRHDLFLIAELNLTSIWDFSHVPISSIQLFPQILKCSFFSLPALICICLKLTPRIWSHHKHTVHTWTICSPFSYIPAGVCSFGVASEPDRRTHVAPTEGHLLLYEHRSKSLSYLLQK